MSKNWNKRISPNADSSSPWITEISLKTLPADGIDKDHGAIKVTLNDNTGYNVAPAPLNEATKTIFDKEIPSISIGNAPQTVSGENASFPLTASIQPFQDIAISYTPVNAQNGGNFLDTTAGASGEQRVSAKINFTSSSGTLVLPTTLDPASTIGRINITIQDDSDPKNYTISQAGVGTSAHVLITEPPTPALSIDKTSPITVTEGSTGTVTIIASENPQRPLNVKYTFNETNTGYLHPSIRNFSQESKINFALDTNTNQYTATINISTRAADGIDADHGNIQVTLNTPVANAGYTVAASPNHQSNITIHDAETPLIKIANADEVSNW